MTTTNNKTTPVGRLVQGNVWETEVQKDDKGVVKVGKDGNPMVSCYFALAIPKAADVAPGDTWAWTKTDWGALVYGVGYAAWPQNYQHPTFAWKIEDGDSIIPNKKGRKNADREGFKGNWILKFSSGFVPTPATLVGQPPGKPAQLTQKGSIKCGDYVQVNFDCAGNNPSPSPGVYLNHRSICLIGYGEPISFGPDIEAAGFGQGVVVPPQASQTPIGGFNPAPPVTAPAPAPVAAPAPAPAPVAAPPPVQPHTAALTAAPLPPSAVPPPAPVKTLTAKAGANTYASMIAAGWSDETMIAHGYMNPM